MNDKLTIIMPFLNEGIEVENTVKSILEHSNNNVNIIAINDGSDDGYNYQDLTSYKNITYIFNEKRLGVAASRDIGVELCNTEYFLLLDAHMRFYSDDWVELIIKKLKKDSKLLLCCQTKSLRYLDGKLVENPLGFTPSGAYIEFNEMFSFLEPKWIYQEKNIVDDKNNETILIPCVLGAGYACSKEYWNFLKGLDGLLYYGSDEPFLSLKVWLSGGKCKLINNITIGHIYRENAPYNHNSLSRVYNRLLIAFLLFPPFLRKKTFSLENFKNPSIFFQANHLLFNNIDDNILKRKYFSSIINQDFNNFKKFNNSQISERKLISKKKKDILLVEIVSYLLSNFSETDDIGILNGKMGVVIFLFHYYKYSNEKIFLQLSEILLEKIQEEITENISLNFASGLAGIGWGIEYLYQNKLIKVDTNDVLFEIDRKIIEIYPFRTTNFNFHYGIGGIIRYILSRLYTITNDGKPNSFINKGFLSDIYAFSKNVVDNRIETDCIDTYIEFILFYESKQQIEHATIYDIDYPKMLNIRNRKFYKYKNIRMKDIIGFGIELILA